MNLPFPYLLLIATLLAGHAFALPDTPTFQEGVWTRVGKATCLKCHRDGGDAEDSAFILRDPEKAQNAHVALVRNQAAFLKMAKRSHEGKSTILLKVRGKLDHGGEDVLKPDSADYKLLADFAARARRGAPTELGATEVELDAFLEGLRFLEPERVLRRVCLSLGSRLPADAERAAVRKDPAALDAVLDQLMTEEAFYVRLAEGFEDIFLTRGYRDSPSRVLSYDHFSKTRHWNNKVTFDHLPEKERERAGWDLGRVYNEAVAREPMETIRYIVENERPITELVTADYIMVSPYTAKGYGIFDGMKQTFKDPEDPHEFHPAQLKALVSRNGHKQVSKTGRFPHAGFLTNFHYLHRYPTTDTNRNRLRARMYYQHFLGVDIMRLAPRVSDAAAIDTAYDIPTMQAAECVVCHRTVDPVAGIFQDYQNDDGAYRPMKEGWFTNMFAAGFEGEGLPTNEVWRAMQWLGERTAKDPRFATAMAEHVWYILAGRKVLVAPGDFDHPRFAARQRAFRVQRQEIRRVAEALRENDFNLKIAFKAWTASPLYRVDGLKAANKEAIEPDRIAELDDLGVVRLLGPEQLARKLEAVLGLRYKRFKETQDRILYGGIDSKTVTERLADPSGAMGSVQRALANDMACKVVANDFGTNAPARRLFGDVEADTVPGTPEADKRIDACITRLHAHVLDQGPEHPDLQLSRDLFDAVLADAAANPGWDKHGKYHCRAPNGKRIHDPAYTIRAWRAVLTFLLRQQEFLYE